MGYFFSRGKQLQGPHQPELLAPLSKSGMRFQLE
jgi:hypothetical protein